MLRRAHHSSHQYYHQQRYLLLDNFLSFDDVYSNSSPQPSMYKNNINIPQRLRFIIYLYYYISHLKMYFFFLCDVSSIKKNDNTNMFWTTEGLPV